MTIVSPKIGPAILLSDNPRLAAVVSCALAVPGHYLPVIDGPRMMRPDGDNEASRRVNAIARSGCKSIALAGLSPDGLTAMTAKLPSKLVLQLDDESSVAALLPGTGRNAPAVIWGRDRIGVGLLRALRSGGSIIFEDGPSPEGGVESMSGHLVVCEAGADLAEIIAANYAFALRAGLVVIPPVANEVSERLLEGLYGLYDRRSQPSEVFDATRSELRALCGDLKIPTGGSITFFTRKLPFGLGFPECPSTHLFTYPDAGIAVINGFAATQSDHPGDNVAVLIDPETTEAPEIEAAAKGLSRRGMFVRVYRGQRANVRDVSDAVEMFPYNLLIFATHCGDAEGLRWTYAFDDSEGISRKLVVDIALGIGRPDHEDRLAVTQFMRFHELDGVDWNDAAKKATLYVGTAINDFMELIRRDDALEPVEKTTVGRVIGSAAMAMFDNNYIPIPRSLADREMPVVFNNACVSWHELAGRFTFAGARAYVGTLVDVTAAEAEEVVTRLLERHFDKALPHALWSAQREVYGTSERRPYVMTGVFSQRLHPIRRDTPGDIIAKLSSAKADWSARLELVRAKSDVRAADGIAPIVEYYSRELAAMRAKWAAPATS